MSYASPLHYLNDIIEIFQTHWPKNRRVNIVAHGHSVPAGYFATPLVNSFDAYPHLLHYELKQRFPFAVMNMICTAIGGEHSESGAARFVDQVLCHQADVVLIDYGLNDRGIGLERAEKAWRQMIEQALERKIRVILLTPTWDKTQITADGRIADTEDAQVLRRHAEQIRSLAAEYKIGLADSYAAYAAVVKNEPLANYLSWANHPNKQGHQLVANALAEWFPPFRMT